jgi:hypothetical protein
MIDAWTDILREHRGQWVALDDDETTVLGSGRNGHSDPIVFRVPTEHINFAGHEIAV